MFVELNNYFSAAGKIQRYAHTWLDQNSVCDKETNSTQNQISI